MANKLQILISRKNELIERIRYLSKLKNFTIKKSQEIVSNFNSGELSKKEYKEKLTSEFKGKHPKDLVSFYNNHIKIYERHLDYTEGLINKETTKFKLKKTLAISFISILIISLFLGVIYIQKQEPITFAPPTLETYTQQINLQTSQNITYNWILENQGELQSIFLSGSFEGEGETKVYLQDNSGNELLILDSSNLRILLNPLENVTTNTTNQTNPNNQTQTNETIIPTNTTNQTNPNNQTQTNETIIPTKKITPFTNICEETCDLSLLNLNQTSYNLRIEISNSTLNLNSITYEILVENIAITPKTNVTNITNQTIPEKITKEEIKIKKGKKVKLKIPKGLENTPVSTQIPKSWKIKAKNSLKVKWEEENQEIQFNAIDSDSDGFIDTLEWSPSSSGTQTFNIIIITKAEHLDSNKSFISNIYEEVKSLDNIWSETIPNQDYVRVTFETNLTSSNDITIFPRITSGNPKIEVYEFNQSNLIAEFTNLKNTQYNKVLLTNLVSESQDVFDLRIVGGSVEFDHIVDPVSPGDGIVVYAPISITPSIFWRYIDTTGTAGIENSFPTGMPSTPAFLRMTSSPTNPSEVILSVTDIGNPSSSAVFVFNNDTQSWDAGTTLTISGSLGAAGKPTLYTDVAYEQQTGDALVVYGDGAGNIYYRAWNGISWGVEQTYSVNGPIQWLTLKADPNSDKIMLVYENQAFNIFSNVWDGTAWGTEQSWGSSFNTAGAKDSGLSDGAWEGISGDGMVLWVDGTGTTQYATYTGSTDTWGTTTSIPGFTLTGNKGGTLRARGFGIGNVGAGHDRIAVLIADGSARIGNSERWDGNTWSGAWQQIGTAIEGGKGYMYDLEWETDSPTEKLHITFSERTNPGMRWQTWDNIAGWSVNSQLSGGPTAALKIPIDLAKHFGSDRMFTTVNNGKGTVGTWLWSFGGGIWGTAQTVSTAPVTGKYSETAVVFLDGRNGAPPINVAWNQPTLSLGTVAGGSSFGSIAQFTASGSHTNIQITPVSGTGISFITPDITSIPSMADAQVQDILFTCAPTNTQTAGVYDAVYKVNSTEDPTGSDITIDCTVTNDPPTDPTNILCNSGTGEPTSCDITVNNAVDIEATGSTDPNGNVITYYIEALMDGIGNSPDLEAGTISLQGQGGGGPGLVTVVGTSSSTNNGGVQGTNPISWTHTTGPGTERALIVGVSFELKFGEVINSITYGGLPLTHLTGADAISGGKVETELWYLTEPLPANGQIVINYNTGPKKVAAGAFTLEGVDQTTPISNEVFNTGTDNNPIVTVTSAVGDMVVDVASQERFNGQFNVGAGQTQQWFETGDGIVNGRFPTGASTETGAASVVMDWTTDIAGRPWAISAANVKAAPGGPVSSVDQPTAYTGYLDIGLSFNIINSIDVQVNVTSFDNTASSNQASLMPDLELEVWDGTQFISVGTFNLPAFYTGTGLQTTPNSFNIQVTNPTVLTAWLTDTNQDIRIRGVNMDHDGSVPDEIIYNNVFVSINGKGWVSIGNHVAGTPLNWDTSLIPDQQDINLRANAIDLAGSNTFSPGYFAKNPTSPYLEILHSANQPPTITDVQSIPNIGLNPGTNRSVVFNFTVEDPDGIADIDDTSAFAAFNKSGEPLRSNTCNLVKTTLTNKTYECNINLTHYDAAGEWSVNISISDIAGPTRVENISTSFIVNLLREISLTPLTINFPLILPGNTNIYSLQNTTITNNGNFNIPGDSNLQVTSRNLTGQINPAENISGDNFRTSNTAIDVCASGTQLSDSAGTLIPGITLPKGSASNPFPSTNITYCITSVPSVLSEQDYSATGLGAWEIIVLATPIIITKRKKKKKRLKEEKLLEILGDNLEDIINLVKENKIKSKINYIKIPLEIFKQNLSPAEAICKYLKESKNLKFSEIALALNRNQRTVWINYRNAIKKKREKLRKVKELNKIPIRIFQNRKLSILESVIIYLKEKGYTNQKISDLTGKKQNNIWTLHKRAIKKIKN